uniref:UMOD/GP2/OIT3-like D8C domain-containing protein n=1 Tax=Sinocyclocheilus grahami TaxID=75366 RepID=A0A672MDE2_SINGR
SLGSCYVSTISRPISTASPNIITGFSITSNYDPYTSLDEPWRATDNSYYNDNYYSGMCDYNVEWNGWYRLFYNGQNAQMPESCVNYGMCGTYYSLSLNGPHPQLEDGVVIRHVCFSVSGCCTYTSHPIRVKACPGNFYVYEFVKPIVCSAYCVGDPKHLLF